MDAFPNRTLGRYRIEGLLGRGGMATVYRALDPHFERVVAIKVLAPQLANIPEYKERFQREARSMARLQHPHILPVYDVGEQDGVVFLVTHYADGGSLHELLAAQHRAGQVRLGELLAILEPVAAALDMAHRRGVIHRDIKPQNILLADGGYPYLTDFGIAKILDQEGQTPAITIGNAVIGTPEYMSPEQAQGAPLDGRSDLYSLGVILYQIFTGRIPFRAESATDTPLVILIRHVTEAPPAPRAVNPQIPPAVEAVLLRALAKRPDNRYPAGAALVGALREALEMSRGPSSRLDLPPVSAPALQLPSLPSLTPPGAAVRTATPPPLPPELRGGTPPPGTGPTGGLPWAAAAGVPAAAPGEPSRRRLPVAMVLGSVIVALVVLAALFLRANAGGRDGATATGVAAVNTPVGTAAAVAGPTPTAPPTLPSTATAPPAPPTTAANVGTTLPPPTATATGGGVAVPATPRTVRREVILFSGNRVGVHDSQLYVMNPDGSGQRQLTFTRGHSWGPRLSPDGRFVVFSSVAPGEHVDHSATAGGRKGEGHHEVYRANGDGSGIIRLTNTTAWNNAWAWSPDGQALIFASDRDGNWELYRMNAKGEEIVRLTNDPAQDGWPSWTPDGKAIVFASDRVGGLSQIFIMDADGKNVRRLNFSESADTLPSVSPDGKRVVYSAQTGTESEIYVMNIDGSNATRLTSTVATNSDPSWSPDGTRIIFSSDRERNSNIYVMNVDGTDVRRLTDDPGEDVTPFWGYIQVSAQGDGAGAVGRGAWGVGREGEWGGKALLAAPFALGLIVRRAPRPTAHGPRPHGLTPPSSPCARPSCRKRRRP